MSDDGNANQLAHEARYERLAKIVQRMPAAAQQHFAEWRRCVELCSRSWSGADSVDFTLRYAESLQQLVVALSAPLPAPAQPGEGAGVQAQQVEPQRAGGAGATAGKIAGEFTPTGSGA